MGADVPNKTAPSYHKNGRLACACMVDMFAVPCSSDLKLYFLFELVDLPHVDRDNIVPTGFVLKYQFTSASCCVSNPITCRAFGPQGGLEGFSVSITVSSVDPIIYQFACVHPRSFTRGNPISLPAS